MLQASERIGVLPTLRERQALALMAARAAGWSGGAGPVERVVDLGEVIPVTWGQRHRSQVPGSPMPRFVEHELVEVLTDYGVVFLTHTRMPALPKDPLVWLVGVHGGYAHHRVRSASSPQRWSARGWWRLPGAPVVGTWYDAADPNPADRLGGRVGQCLLAGWLDGRPLWGQPPDGSEAVILEWTPGPERAGNYWTARAAGGRFACPTT